MLRLPVPRRIASLAAVGIALTTLAGLAPSPVIVRDRFTNNAINPTLWDQHSFGVVTLSEINQRLQFAAPVNSGGESYAGLEVAPWGANWRYDFEIEVDYKLNLSNVSGSREVLLGIGLALVGQFPENFTGFAAAVGRDDAGLFLAIARYNNGNIVAFDDANLGAAQGQLTLEWDRSSDQFRASVGATEVALNGAWAQFGAAMGNQPMVIGIGCMTVNGNRTFPGSRVFMDEFKFDGVKRAR
jgi:hypothetical protein